MRKIQLWLETYLRIPLQVLLSRCQYCKRNQRTKNQIPPQLPLPGVYWQEAIAHLQLVRMDQAVPEIFIVI